MRPLKIATKNTDHLFLEGIPEEFNFIEYLSKRYAHTNEELKSYYLIGVNAAVKFKLETSQKDYESHVTWIVDQTIKEQMIKFKKKKHSS